MRNIYYIVAAVIGVLLIAGILFFTSARKENNTGQPSPTVTLPSAGTNKTSPQKQTSSQTSTPTSSQLEFLWLGSGNDTMQVRNFLKDPDTISDPSNKDYYVLGKPSSTGNAFTITYIASTQFFIIELTKEPLNDSREKAQNYLEKLLGISPEDLCRLNYTVSAPNEVSNRYAGESLGFNVCPGAIELPR